MRRALIAVAVLVCGLLAVPAKASPTYPRPSHLSVRDRRIVDEQGRTVILRGVNVNQLGDYFQGNPAVPSTLPFSRTDFERIAALGLDSVRLIVSWSALEPKPGVRDTAYLARVRQAVGWARELGLYVILDMHQDAWGKAVATAKDQTCPAPLQPAIGFDGAPAWATLTDGLTHCRFQIRELSPAVGNSFQSFWLDRNGIQQHLVDTWGWLAGAFKTDPTVAGYDLLNEPNPGYVPGGTDLTLLGEFYRRSTEAIRRGERGGLTKIVFFEPMITWDLASVGLPRPWTTDTQIAYAPHIYQGSLSADRAVAGRDVLPLSWGFDQAERDATVYRAPVWSGEWGPFGDAAFDADYSTRFAALEDQHQFGSAFWQWKQSCGDPHGVSWPDGRAPAQSGNLVIVTCGDPAQPAGVDQGLLAANARVLSRPYPRAFPSPATFHGDPASRVLTMDGTGQGGVLLWVPGAARPSLVATGVPVGRVTQVRGGWLVEARTAAAHWSLRAEGG